jgi:hypothetical protein
VQQEIELLIEILRNDTAVRYSKFQLVRDDERKQKIEDRHIHIASEWLDKAGGRMTGSGQKINSGYLI